MEMLILDEHVRPGVALLGLFGAGLTTLGFALSAYILADGGALLAKLNVSLSILLAETFLRCHFLKPQVSVARKALTTA